ncbi:transglutaminaseTgpA domain-containing protein [Hyalangium minutum]|uniref:Transglutaminase-like enzyme, putative cysteine protease n=1 Tax=Hyalangium minutum TaxID=394096 RepID=A0A085W6I7_9BACT|nr:transglutaminase domain-containing protein [Hyalangium minutum]KFE63300.1 Transglutaminase-like enzyme, putative cysteine protease [Hyalangium minutum]
MSQDDALPSRLERGMEMLPALAALALHALAHERWLLCIPAAVVLATGLILGKQPRYSSPLLLISALGGGVVGFVLSGLWPVPAPIPPAFMGPLCGALVALTTLCALCGRRVYALTYALLLSSLSVTVRGGAPVYVGMAAVILSLLALAFFRGRIGQAGLTGGLSFGVFALVVLGVAFGLWRFVRASEGVLTDTVFRMMSSMSPSSGLALQSEIPLERQGSMPDTDLLLLELRGDEVQRLRTSVFDVFNGTRWMTSPPLEQTRLTLPKPAPGEAQRTTELTLQQSLRNQLPAPAGTYSVEGVEVRVVGGWTLRAEGRSGTTLTLRSSAREQLPPEPPPTELLTSLPPALKEELAPLAEQLTRGATTSRARAEALEAWFRDNYEYSLSVDLRGEGSPLAVLIREKRAAWCTYFASAMAALLRAQGIPARLAGGFVPQEKNPYSDAFLVRSRDAHAWVEVYLEEEGRFVPFDPTPWRSREALMAQKAPGQLGAAWQAFTSAFRRGLARLWNSPSEALSGVASSPVTWLLVLAGLAWRLLARYRRGRVSQARAALRGESPALAAAYARYLRAMKRGAGLIPSPTETDEELLHRLRTTRGDRAGSLAEAFLTRYRQARYGGAPVDGASLGGLTAELERHLRQER